MSQRHLPPSRRRYEAANPTVSARISGELFRALAEANINVKLINTSEVRVNVVVDGSKAEPARDALEAAFAHVMQ